MNKNLLTRALAVGLLLLALAGVARADGDTLALVSAAPASGGGALSGGEYALVSALGQPVAGELAGDEYSLSSGAVPPGMGAQPAPRASVYLPLILSDR